MNLAENSFIAKTLLRQGARFGRKVLCLSILILLGAPFQLSGPMLQAGYAAERLPVVVLDDMKGKPLFISLLESIQNAGFTPRTVREEDFAFNVNPKVASVVLVPVGAHITPEALTMLGRYIAQGGRIILMPTGETPDASVVRLFALAGMPVNGLAHVSRNLAFNWKGRVLPSGEGLFRTAPLLMIQPNAQMDVLATWGSDLPAIATTGKGAILNWQWGQELSELFNMVALSKVVYPGKADPLIMLQQDEGAAARRQQSLVSLPRHRREPLGPEVQPNPKAVGLTGVIALPQSSAATNSSLNMTVAGSSSTPPVAVPLGPIITPTPSIPANGVSQAQSPVTAEAASPAGSAVQVAPSAMSGVINSPKPSSTASNHLPVSPVSVSQKAHAPTKAKATAPAAKAEENADTEVINNILGIHASATDKPDAAPAASNGKPAEGQQHFSFLDPGAAAVLAPAFDYGVYSLNLRKLDDYHRRTRDALEAGRQLSLDLPEDQVNALWKEADLHKRKFEAFYLAGQTQAGLDENALAQHAALQALALTTTSPQVEGRAIWMDRGSILACGGAEGLKARMRQLHQAGINIVYFETVNAGFPIYPSKIVSHNPMVNGWDPLRVAVDEGHKQGMEVHAWVWAFAVGNRRHNALINKPDDYAGPILTEGGMMGEALRNREGGLSVDSHQHEFWLSPASPKARDFLVNLYREIVTNYDVDGLQLDYIRYPFQTQGNRMGFETVGRERFTQSTGKSLDNMDDYTTRVWTAWKTYQVSSFVQQVSTALKKIKPELKLSAAVFPMHREARIGVIQQDWETWIDNGWIDTLSPMSYTSDPARLQELFEYVQNSPRKHPMVYAGIALPRLDGGQLVQQVVALRQKGGLGTTLFAGSHLDDDKASTLAAGPYKQLDSLPPHQDVVKSLQVILGDYREKLQILRQKGVLTEIPAQQTDSLQAALQHLDDALSVLGSGRPLRGISAKKLQVANQRLSELGAVSQAWCNADKPTHPYRAEYFERDLLLLNEIMGYTMDKLSLAPLDKSGVKPILVEKRGMVPASVVVQGKVPAPITMIGSPPLPVPAKQGPTATVQPTREALP